LISDELLIFEKEIDSDYGPKALGIIGTTQRNPFSKDGDPKRVKISRIKYERRRNYSLEDLQDGLTWIWIRTKTTS